VLRGLKSAEDAKFCPGRPAVPSGTTDCCSSTVALKSQYYEYDNHNTNGVLHSVPETFSEMCVLRSVGAAMTWMVDEAFCRTGPRTQAMATLNSGTM